MQRPSAPALVCGLLTVDVVYEVAAVPKANEKVVAAGSWSAVGGPAANAAIACTGLGVPAHLITHAGRGPLDGLARRLLAGRGVGATTPEAEPAPDWSVPVSSVLITPDGRRAVVSTNTLGAPTTALSTQESSNLLDEAACLLVDGHHLPLAIPLARAAAARGVPVILDGGSWKPGLERLLPHVTGAVVSADFRPPGHSMDALESWPGRPPFMAVSAGSDPLRWATRNARGVIDIAHVPIVDTLGAGDVLHGALLAGLSARGRSWPADEDAWPSELLAACAVASTSCRYRGATGWLDTHRADANPGELLL